MAASASSPEDHLLPTRPCPTPPPPLPPPRATPAPPPPSQRPRRPRGPTCCPSCLECSPPGPDPGPAHSQSHSKPQLKTRPLGACSSLRGRRRWDCAAPLDGRTVGACSLGGGARRFGPCCNPHLARCLAPSGGPVTVFRWNEWVLPKKWVLLPLFLHGSGTLYNMPMSQSQELNKAKGPLKLRS